MPKKLIITGATGFVGRYIVKEALKRQYEVCLIVRNPSKAKALFGESVNAFALKEFTDLNSLRQIIQNISPDYVIHLIGIIQEDKGKGITFHKVHYEYPKALYTVLKDFPIKKVVHMSALGVNEQAPSKYHITKLMAEKELIKSGLSYVILRPSVILGPEQLLFVRLNEILSKMPFLIFPEIKEYHFQPIDVRDVAGSFLNALDWQENAVFELCGDTKVTFGQMVKHYAKNRGKRVLLLPVPKGFLKIFIPEQYKMMWRDNICGYSKEAKSTEEILRRKPIPYHESIRWSATNQ